MCSSCFFTTLVVWQNILGGVISIGVDGSVSFFRTAATTLAHVHDHWAYGVVLGDRTIDKAIQKPVQRHEDATRHCHHKHWHRCWCISCTQNERGLQKKLKVGEWGWVRVKGGVPVLEPNRLYILASTRWVSTRASVARFCQPRPILLPPAWCLLSTWSIHIRSKSHNTPTQRSPSPWTRSSMDLLNRQTNT